MTEYLEQAPTTLKDLYAELESYCESLGDDVSKKALKFYFAFRRLKNFACVEVHPQTKTLLVYLKVDPDQSTSSRIQSGCAEHRPLRDRRPRTADRESTRTSEGLATDPESYEAS